MLLFKTNKPGQNGYGKSRKNQKPRNWAQRSLERIKVYIGENLSADLRTAVVCEKFDGGVSTYTIISENTFPKAVSSM